ncbi:hypothetical protein [Nostoc sp.]
MQTNSLARFLNIVFTLGDRIPLKSIVLATSVKVFCHRAIYN